MLVYAKMIPSWVMKVLSMAKTLCVPESPPGAAGFAALVAGVFLCPPSWQVTW